MQNVSKRLYIIFCMIGLVGIKKMIVPLRIVFEVMSVYRIFPGRLCDMPAGRFTEILLSAILRIYHATFLFKMR